MEGPLFDLDSSGTLHRSLAVQYKTGVNLRRRVGIYRYLHQEKIPGGSFDEWVLDHIVWSGGEKAADVGCGPGHYLSSLARRAAAVVALDVSEGMVDEARAASRGAPATSVLVADAQRLPLPDSSMDVLLSAHMLYHVPDLELAMAEFRRVLKPGGALLVALNGSADKSELRATWEQAGVSALGEGFAAPRWMARANLEDTPARIARHFGSITVDHLPGVFRFPTSEPPMEWIESLRPGTEEVIGSYEWKLVVDEACSRIEDTIATEGEFVTTKDSGVIVAR